MIIKNAQQINLMEEGGKRLSNILKALLQEVKPDILTADLNKIADTLIKKTGGEASFKTVKGYKWATCMSVNDEVVHGIPDDRLKEGDILCIDIGLLYKGFHTDMAWTILVKSQKSPPKADPPLAEKVKSQREQEIERFLETGETALLNAINQAKVGNRIGHISKAIQEIIEGGGYSVVKALIGHGIGENLHEDPQIPGYFDREITNTLLLKEGMTLAIEVIYNKGLDNVVYKGNDNWTIVTKDGSLSSVFEHTIAVTKSGPKILTNFKPKS